MFRRTGGSDITSIRRYRCTADASIRRYRFPADASIIAFPMRHLQVVLPLDRVIVHANSISAVPPMSSYKRSGSTKATRHSRAFLRETFAAKVLAYLLLHRALRERRGPVPFRGRTLRLLLRRRADEAIRGQIKTTDFNALPFALRPYIMRIMLITLEESTLSHPLACPPHACPTFGRRPGIMLLASRSGPGKQPDRKLLKHVSNER